MKTTPHKVTIAIPVGYRRLKVVKLLGLLNEVLDHQIANRGTPNAFYRCYTYGNRGMPAWVAKAERAIKDLNSGPYIAPLRRNKAKK